MHWLSFELATKVTKVTTLIKQGSSVWGVYFQMVLKVSMYDIL